MSVTFHLLSLAGPSCRVASGRLSAGVHTWDWNAHLLLILTVELPCRCLCESPSFLLALAPDTWQGWCFLILTLVFSGLPLPHTSFITFSQRTWASFLSPHKHRRCFSGPTAQARQQLRSWKCLLLQHEKPTSDPQPLVRAQGYGQR